MGNKIQETRGFMMTKKSLFTIIVVILSLPAMAMTIALFWPSISIFFLYYLLIKDEPTSEQSVPFTFVVLAACSAGLLYIIALWFIFA